MGVPQNLAGMLATTWACGALAIVQKLSVMPSSLHPCNKLLAGALTDRPRCCERLCICCNEPAACCDVTLSLDGLTLTVRSDV